MLQQKGEWIYVFIAVLAVVSSSPTALVDGHDILNGYANPPCLSDGEFVYIVYTKGPPEGVEPSVHYGKILTPIVGSAKAAQEALLYTCRNINCFSARLTPQQASLLTDDPVVEYLYIQPNNDPEDYIDG